MTPKRILCVENDEDICSMIELMLTHAGYEVLPVSTINEALLLAKTQTLDLFIVNPRLPDGDGVDLCHEIRRFDKRTPIVFFSAEAREAERTKALSCGAQEYLVKPNDLGHLVSTASRLISGVRPVVLGN